MHLILIRCNSKKIAAHIPTERLPKMIFYWHSDYNTSRSICQHLITKAMGGDFRATSAPLKPRGARAHSAQKLRQIHYGLVQLTVRSALSARSQSTAPSQNLAQFPHRRARTPRGLAARRWRYFTTGSSIRRSTTFSIRQEGTSARRGCYVVSAAPHDALRSRDRVAATLALIPAPAPASVNRHLRGDNHANARFTGREPPSRLIRGGEQGFFNT